MRNTTFIILSLFSSACFAQKTYSIIDSSAISDTLDYRNPKLPIRKGTFCVLMYVEESPNFKQTMEVDAGFRSTLLFEIEYGKEIIILKDSDLVHAKAVVFFDCHCSTYGPHKISKGYIKGKKQENGDWKIEVNVTTTDFALIGGREREYSVKTTGLFKK